MNILNCLLRVIVAFLFCSLVGLGTLCLVGGYQYRESEIHSCQIVNNTACLNGTNYLWIELDDHDQKVNVSKVFCEDLRNCCQYEVDHNSTLNCLVEDDRVEMVIIPDISVYIIHAFMAGIIILSVSGFCCAVGVIALMIQHQRKQKYVLLNQHQRSENVIW